MFEIIENDLTPALIEKYAVPPIDNYIVYFDPTTYDILSITNEKSNNLTSFFEVDFEKVKMFLTGNSDPRQFKVILNPSKTFEIVSKIINQDLKSSMLVPILPNEDTASLTIMHCDSSWKIILSSNEKQRLANDIIDYSLYIFITSTKNRNFLYRTIIVNLDELIKTEEIIVPFENVIEKDMSKIMLSTIKFFESYSLKYE